MRRHLIHPTSWESLSSIETLPQLVDYLKQHPTYAPYFADFQMEHISRFELERRLYQAFNTDFVRIYQFADLSSRRYLKAFAVDLLVFFLKKTIHAIFRDSVSDIDLRPLWSFFQSKLHIDPQALYQAKTLPAVIEALRGTPLHDPLETIYEQHGEQLIYMETFLDQYAFSALTHHQHITTSLADRSYNRQYYGTLLDCLNIATIYRTKRYYHVPDANVVPFLFPTRYKLSAQEQNALLHSESVAQMLDVLQTTYYGDLCKHLNETSLDHAIALRLAELQKALYRRHPDSIAMLGSYFFRRRQEISVLIALTESLRYQHSRRETGHYLQEVMACL